MLFLLAQVVQAFIGSYPVHPGEKLGIGTEVLEPLPYLDKGILHHVIRIVVLGHHAAYMPVYLLLVLFDQQLKGPLPRGAGVKKVKDLAVRHSGGGCELMIR